MGKIQAGGHGIGDPKFAKVGMPKFDVLAMEPVTRANPSPCPSGIDLTK